MTVISRVDREISNILADSVQPIELEHLQSNRHNPRKVIIKLDNINFEEIHSLKTWAEPFITSALVRLLTPKDNITAYTPTLEYFVSKIGSENDIFYYLKPWLSHPHNNSPPLTFQH
mgnify:FL=1